MAYPPEFNENYIYPEILNLDQIDVFLDLQSSNPMYIEVTELPNILTYGKHYGTISVKDPVINNTPFYSNPPPTSGQSEMYMLPGGGGSVDLSAVDQDIVPDADNTRDLGSSSKKFAELHLSGSTIFLGNAKIKATAAGDLTDANDNRIGVTNEEGTPVRLVPLFTAAGGLTTPAKRFAFKASSPRDRVFRDTFKKANGDSVTATRATQLFEF